MRLAAGTAAALAAVLLATGCTSSQPAPPGGSAPPAQSRSPSSATPRAPSGPGATAAPGDRSGTLKLGFTLSLADAPALAGLQAGYFATAMRNVTLEPAAFSSDTAESAALEDGRLDAAYLDPVAAVRVWQLTRGRIAIIAGAASGGAELVVRDGITSARQLAHAPLAAPAGGAQAAALSWWLHQRRVPGPGAGRVTMTSSFLIRALQARQIAGAWEPAPQDAALIAAGGHLLVNEASLWPGGQFSSAVLVVTRRYLAAHPAAVAGLLNGHIQAEALLTASPAAARAAVAAKRAGFGATDSLATVMLAFAQVTFTTDPLAGTIRTEAQHAAAAGLLAPARSLGGLFDLAALNKLLIASGRHPVAA